MMFMFQAHNILNRPIGAESKLRSYSSNTEHDQKVSMTENHMISSKLKKGGDRSSTLGRRATSSRGVIRGQVR